MNDYFIAIILILGFIAFFIGLIAVKKSGKYRTSFSIVINRKESGFRK